MISDHLYIPLVGAFVAVVALIVVLGVWLIEDDR